MNRFFEPVHFTLSPISVAYPASWQYKTTLTFHFARCFAPLNLSELEKTNAGVMFSQCRTLSSLLSWS